MNSELKEKVEASIARLQGFCPPEGYYLAFSGGKDSVVVKRLLDMSGCKYDATYRITSVDPPELYRFIREQHPDVTREYPRDKDGNVVTMWNLIPPKLMPPTRIVRYCCSSLKESGGDGRMTVTGVRWAESKQRQKNQGIVIITSKKAAKELKELDDSTFRVNKNGCLVLTNDNDDTRRVVESCYKRHKTVINPIIEWQDADVWEFIRSEQIPYCTLYDEGWTRLGCIGCPIARKHGREREFLRWPKYKKAYLLTFKRMLEQREKRGLMQGAWNPSTEPIDVFNWWMEYDILPGQMDLLEDDESWSW